MMTDLRHMADRVCACGGQTDTTYFPEGRPDIRWCVVCGHAATHDDLSKWRFHCEGGSTVAAVQAYALIDEDDLPADDALLGSALLIDDELADGVLTDSVRIEDIFTEDW